MARFNSFVDIVAATIKEAYFKVEGMEGKVGDRLNTEFKSHLDNLLCRYLAPLLETQDQKFFVDLVEKGEHEFRVTVAAEKGSYDYSLPGSYSLYWAITIKVNIEELNTLEEAAGLVVAKAFGIEGCSKSKVDQLEIPGRLKEVIMRFLALPEMEIERNDITRPSLEEDEWANEEVDNQEEGNEGAVNNWALVNVVDPEAHGAHVGEDGGEDADSEGDGGESEGGVPHFNDQGEADSDFPVMHSSWSGQLNWAEEGGDGDEEEELVPGEDLGEGEMH